MTVRVIAPAVQVAVGVRMLHLERGQLLPDGVAEADVARLIAKGMVAEVVPVIEDGAEFIDGAAVDTPDALAATAEPAQPEKPQACKPAEK